MGATVLRIPLGFPMIIGALSLHAQIGFSDPFLDGGAIPAAVLLANAVVALTRVRSDAASPSTTRRTP